MFCRPCHNGATATIPFGEIRAEYDRERPASRWVAGSRGEGLVFDELLASLTKSFAGITNSDGTLEVDGEPIMMWCINHVKTPDLAKTRTELVEFMVSFYLNEMLSRNYLAISKESDDGEIVSTAVLTEYDPVQMEGKLNEMAEKWRQFTLGCKLAMTGKLPSLIKSKDLQEEAKAWERKGNLFTSKLRPNHKQYGPPDRHIYVAFVGSNPDFQGQGYGSELMRELNGIADRRSLALYLETGGDKNRRFYE